MGHARHLRCRKKGACDWGPWPRKRFARIRLNLHYCSRSGVPEGVSVDGGDGGEGQALGKHLEEGAIYVAESRGHSDPGLLAGLARLEREKQLARTRYARKKAMKKCAKPWAGNPPPQRRRRCMRYISHPYFCQPHQPRLAYHLRTTTLAVTRRADTLTTKYSGHY